MLRACRRGRAANIIQCLNKGLIMKRFGIAMSVLLAVICIGCQQDDRELNSPIPEMFYMFPGCDDTFGVKEVSADATGGEIAVPTRETYGGKNISVQNIITGARLVWVEYPRVEMEISGDADYVISRCVAGDAAPSPNGFEWCNPWGRDLWVHQWLAVSQDDAHVYIYIQPNEGAELRTAFVVPLNYTVHGFIKVIQAGKDI